METDGNLEEAIDEGIGYLNAAAEGEGLIDAIAGNDDDLDDEELGTMQQLITLLVIEWISESYATMTEMAYPE